jgi:alpha/beta superfamily hydrolase
METAVTVESDGLRIEGMLTPGTGDRGVVVSHPHPLYGGDMDNPVVEAITEVYTAKGYTALRFNFRGAGRSEGRFDEGVGEQVDVMAAVAYLENLGIDHVDMAGYSFGAWVNAGAAHRLGGVGDLVLVAPPVGFVDFSSLEPSDKIKLIVVGGDDDIAPAQGIHLWVGQADPPPKVEIIAGADHFFSGNLHRLTAVLAGHL